MKKASLQKMLAGFTAICSVASAMPVSNVTTAAAASTNVVYGDANCDISWKVTYQNKRTFVL